MDSLQGPIQDSPALWQVLADLHLPWGKPTGNGSILPLTSEVFVSMNGGETGQLTLAFGSLYVSEHFFHLLGGEGDYTREEWDDPSEVMERRHQYAEELLRRWQAEALPFLGEPSTTEGDPLRRVTWTLPQMNVFLESRQDDKETPVEVNLILTPTGLRPP